MPDSSLPLSYTLPVQRTLRMGDTGPAVAALQKMLALAGASPTVTPDGIFGVQTRAAVTQAQTACGVAATGETDPTFIQALEDALLAAPETAMHPSEPPVPTVAGGTLGERALAIAQAELDAGVQEQPLGSHRGPQVDVYERLVGVLAAPWCACFASYCRRRALAPGEGTQLGYHAAVHALWASAVQAGLARQQTYTPAPGDLAVFKRAGQDPRNGGEGHVGRVESIDATTGDFTCLEGNVEHKVGRRVHPLADAELCGYVMEG